MRLRECASKLLFWRKEAKAGQRELCDGKIICEDERIYELITNWLNRRGVKWLDLKNLFNSAGLESPIILGQFCEYGSFNVECVTGSGRMVRILFSLVDEIFIEDGEVKRKYIIKEKRENDVIRSEIYLQKKEICRDGKELTSYYTEFSCNRTLRVDDTHVLKVNTAVREAMIGDEDKLIDLLRSEAIEEYLIGLDSSLIVDEVYQKLMGAMDFSDEDFDKMKTFIVSYEEWINERYRVRALIDMRYSKLEGYAYMENGSTYHLFNSGRCEYISDIGIIICYNIFTRKFSIELFDCGEIFLACTDIHELIQNVTETFDRAYINNKEFFS